RDAVEREPARDAPRDREVEVEEREDPLDRPRVDVDRQRLEPVAVAEGPAPAELAGERQAPRHAVGRVRGREGRERQDVPVDDEIAAGGAEADPEESEVPRLEVAGDQRIAEAPLEASGDPPGASELQRRRERMLL